MMFIIGLKVIIRNLKKDILNVTKSLDIIKNAEVNGLENIRQVLIVQTLKDFPKNNIVNMDANNNILYFEFTPLKI